MLLASSMETPHTRLKAARIAAGFRSAAQAAKQVSLDYKTYVAHENGSRVFTAQTAKKYANVFGTSAEQILFGKGEDIPVPLTNQPLAIDPILLKIWKKLKPMQRKKLIQIALILSEE
jgi:DNA-binding XRE family transcriptional regulator